MSSRLSLRAIVSALAALTGGCAHAPQPQTSPGRTARPAPHYETPLPVIARRGEYVTFQPVANGFAWVNAGDAAAVWISPAEPPAVRRAVRDLLTDVEKVTGLSPQLFETPEPPKHERLVAVGTLGKSAPIDQLAASKRLGASYIAGRWETSLEQVVAAPWPGTEQALVLAGSDVRGTIYAIYDLSQSIGVSPWYYWDDVPAQRHDAVWVKPGVFTQGTPAVRYRGFFINDEAPALATWALDTFGPAPNPTRPHGFNHRFYAKVFEVLLRLKANYLWPAVWSRSLFDDDPENQKLASDFGIVMGTSHEAPMMRAQDEWDRYGQASGPYGGNGAFSFVRNQATIERYWEDGIERANGYEGLVTVGMRGNGDVGMEDAQGIELMQRIVSTQRRILERVTGKPASEIPQVWTMYKEVQHYWEEGMRAPDDVTIIWCDDNWGNLRGLPDAQAAKREGGHGIYYHFDYVGGGRNYKWVDTVNLANTWEQLHLAYERGARQVWMVNVGDLKNIEQPLQFFLDYAWSPEALPLETLPDWEMHWAGKQFGSEQASAIARVFSRYHQLQARRKPELLNRAITLDPAFDLATRAEHAIVYRDASPFSIDNYRELDRVTEEWQHLATESTTIWSELPPQYRDAYFELVHYGVAARANVYALRRAEFLNIHYAAQGRVSANQLAEEASESMARDRELSRYYNEDLAGGRWRGFQTQPKLGYGGPYANSSWQQPELDGRAAPDFLWPALQSVKPLKGAHLGVAVSGSNAYFPKQSHLELSEQSPFQTTAAPTVDVFNRGQTSFAVRFESKQPWVAVTPSNGDITSQTRFTVNVDFARAPTGNTTAQVIVLASTGERATLELPITKPDTKTRSLQGFIEANGYVAIDAEHFHRKVDVPDATWTILPGLGRTGAGVTTFPVTTPRIDPGSASPRLEYDVELFTAGNITVAGYLSPRLPTLATDGLLYGVSIDDGAIQVVNTTASQSSKPDSRGWERNTSNNVNLTTTVHRVNAPGRHTVKFWMIDPTVILQRLVLDTGGLQPSYLGPPESLRK
jgi:hypothetical protein